MNQDIMRINYNNKELRICIHNDQIIYKELNDNKLVDISDKNNINILNLIYLYYTDAKQIISSSPFYYDDEKIVARYNINNKIFEFENLNNNSPIDSLNYSFNNQKIYYYKSDKPKEKNIKFYKKIIKIGSGLVITVFLSSSIFFSYIPITFNNPYLFYIDYKIDSIYKKEIKYENTEEKVELALKSIDNNRYLTIEEKEFLKNIKTELIENKEYIDFDELNNDLSELHLKYNPYHPDKTKPYYVMYQMSGQYTYIGSDKNLIELFGDDNNNSDCFETCDKTTLVHEVNHLLNNELSVMNVKGKTGDILEQIYLKAGVDDFQLSEMINEMFAREYQYDFNINDKSEGYYWEMPIMYCLAEIIDENTLRYFKFNSDSYYITNYLSELGVPLEDICEFYIRLNDVYSLYDKSESPYATSDDMKKFKDNNLRILELLNEM